MEDTSSNQLLEAQKQKAKQSKFTLGTITYYFAHDFITIEKDGDFFFNVHFGSDCKIQTKEEAEGYVKRIVKCWNNEWKVDMHNDLINKLDAAVSALGDLLPKLNSSERKAMTDFIISCKATIKI